MNPVNYLLYLKTIFIVIATLSCCIAFSFSPTDTIPQGNFTIQEYDISDGLRQMQVNSIFTSSRGDVWVGTRSGVCTFNNGEFDTFDDLVVKPNYVSDIKELSDGTIVILASSSLYYYNGNKFVEKKLPNDSKYSFRASIEVDQDDRLYLKSFYKNNGIVIDGDSIVSFEKYFPYLTVSDLRSIVPIPGSENYLLLSNSSVISKCNHRDSTCIEIYRSKKNIPTLYETMPFIATNNRDNNKIYFIENIISKELQHIELDLKTMMVDTLFSDNHPIKYNVTPDSEVLIKSQGSLFVLSDNKIEYLIQNFKKPYNTILSIAINNNQFYIGTDKGLIVFSRSEFTNYNEERYNNVWTINETNDNRILLASYTKGLRYLDQDYLIKPQYDPTLSNEDNRFILNNNRTYYFGGVEDKNGNIYLSHQDGIFKFANEKLYNFFPKKNIQICSPTLINYYDDTREYFFRGTCPGVDVIDNEGHLIKKIDSTLFPHNCILTINKTSDDTYWFGATGGIAKYDYQLDTTYNYEYAKGEIEHSAVISSLLDDKNKLWIGGKNGISHYNVLKDSFEIVEELRNYEVNSIIQTASDKYFLATVRGLLMVDLNTYLNNGHMRSRLFTSADGLQGLELGQNGLFIDSKENVWVTSSTNIMNFDPERLHYRSTDLIPITKKINGERLHYNNDKFLIEYGENNVNIEYGLSQNSNDKDIQYRHKINNTPWSKWSHNHSAQFSSLSSGDYTFELVSRNIINQNCKSKIHKLNFCIDLPLHKEPYFDKVLGLLALSLLILSFVLFRNRKLKQEIVELLEKKNNQLIFEKNELSSINLKLHKKIAAVQAIKPREEIDQNKFIDIKVLDKIHKIRLKDILYIIAEDSGLRIYTESNSLWTKVTMKVFLNSLSDEGFIKIFRGTAINVRHIKWVNHTSLMMNDNTELKIGRTYKDSILKSFES